MSGRIEDELARLVREAVADGLAEGRHVIRQELEVALKSTSSRPLEDQIFTTAEVAKLTKFKDETIRGWVSSGRITPMGGRPYRFRYEEVARALRDEAPTATVIDLQARVEEAIKRRKRGGA